MQNKIKYFLSLLIVLVSLISLFTVNISATSVNISATSGSTLGEDHGVIGNVDGANSGWMISNESTKFRIKVFKINDTNYSGYFTGGSSGTDFTYPADNGSVITSATDYFDTDNSWYYITSGYAIMTSYVASGMDSDGSFIFNSNPVSMHATNDNYFTSVFGVNFNLDNIDNYLNNSERDAAKEAKILEFANLIYQDTEGGTLSADDEYFIIVEQLHGFGIKTVGQESTSGYTTQYLATRQELIAWQTQIHDDSLFSSGASQIDAVINKTSNHHCGQGSTAPFGWSYDGTGSGTFGYSIYSGTVGIGVSSQVAANVAVEYKGDMGTNDSSQFVKAGSLVSTNSTTTAATETTSANTDYSLYYWDLSSNSFQSAASGDSKILNFTGVIDTSSQYALVATDMAKFTKGTSAITAKEIVEGIRDCSTSGWSLTWGHTPVSHVVSGDLTAGYMLTIESLSIDGQGSTLAIITNGIQQKFASLFGGTISNQESNNSSLIASAIDITEACRTNFLTASRFSVTGSTRVTGNNITLNAQGVIGLGTELIVKSEPVTSYLKSVSVQATTAGNQITSSLTQIDNVTYTASSWGSLTIDSASAAFIVVPNSIASQDSALESNLLAANLEDTASILSAIQGTFSSYELSGNSTGTVYLGCTDTTPIEGYTVYQILVSGTIFDPGSVELPSYMLNKYFDNIIQTSSTTVGHTVTYNIKKDVWTKKKGDSSAYYGSDTCSVCNTTYEPTTRSTDPNVYKSWIIRYTDISSGTPIVNWDNESNLHSRYFITMDENPIWEKCIRSNLLSGVTQDTKSENYPARNTVDYGFNLVRAVKDNKAISGVRFSSYEAGTDSDTENMLKLKDYFGITLPTVSRVAVRNPLATFEAFSETLKITSVYDYTGGSGWDDSIETHTDEKYELRTNTDGSTSRVLVDQDEVSYYAFSSKNCFGFTLNSTQSCTTLEYTWTNTIYKYQTDVIGIGKNSFLGYSDYKNLETSAQQASDGIVTESNGYRYSNVRKTNVTLKFLPDVQMAFKNGGTVWSGIKSSAYKMTYVLGEEERSSESTGLYMFRISGTGENAVQGVTYSDAMSGGSTSLGKNNVTIPAGADVDLVAQLDGISINCYGYVLDEIATTDSELQGFATTYAGVVASGADIYNTWNGENSATTNRATLLEEFQNWLDGILTVDNFSADFELYRSGSMVSQNFSAVISEIQQSDVDEDGVFVIQIENGAICHDDGYDKLIAQIAADYKCSNSEATALFEDSGLYTSIISAIESSDNNTNISYDGTGSFSTFTNNSGEALVGEDSNTTDWTNQLGGNGNWYDEKVRTFVIRRFTSLDNKFGDIIAADKIDYNLANSGNSNTSQNANSDVSVSAGWKLNIFFNSERQEEVNKWLLGDSTSFYDPSNSTDKSGATSDYTMIMSSVPVQGADFNISSSTTSDFGY